MWTLQGAWAATSADAAGQCAGPGPVCKHRVHTCGSQVCYSTDFSRKKNSMSGGGAFGNDDRGPHTFYLNPCILSVLREHPTPPTPPGYVPFHHILPTPACRTSGMSRAMSTILIVCLYTFVVFPLASKHGICACGDTSFLARSTSSHLIRQHCVSEQGVSYRF